MSGLILLSGTWIYDHNRLHYCFSTAFQPRFGILTTEAQRHRENFFMDKILNAGYSPAVRALILLDGLLDIQIDRFLSTKLRKNLHWPACINRL
jgi:hypothetical protein